MICIGIGIVKDTNLRSTQTGKSVCSAKLEESFSYVRDGQTQKGTKTTLLSAWEPVADLLNVANGQYCVVRGELKNRSYEDRATGKTKWITEVDVKEVQLMGVTHEPAQQPEAPTPEAPMPQTPEDDLPF